DALVSCVCDSERALPGSSFAWHARHSAALPARGGIRSAGARGEFLLSRLTDDLYGPALTSRLPACGLEQRSYLRIGRRPLTGRGAATLAATGGRPDLRGLRVDGSIGGSDLQPPVRPPKTRVGRC